MAIADLLALVLAVMLRVLTMVHDVQSVSNVGAGDEETHRAGDKAALNIS